MSSLEELNQTVLSALKLLPKNNKASFLLDTSLALINAGKYGDDVENYLDVYLRTPDLPVQDVTRALLARAEARRARGENLLTKAQADYQAVLNIDPTNQESRNYFKKERLIYFKREPAFHRTPPEIWERIASYIPRYHLRSWLSVSPFHRDIASRLIFRTLDIYFGGEELEATNRGLDIFDRAKADPVFASRVKCLRFHWSYEECDMLDLMIRMFKTHLPTFKSLQDFEWIGYPEMSADIVQVLLSTHSNLKAIGSVGFHFDAVGVSAFDTLTKFTLRAEDDDGFADMGEIRAILDLNSETLVHLILGASLARQHSWDDAFHSPTISKLIHLDLVDTSISHLVLSRIIHTAHLLETLTLHGSLEDASAAKVVFASDHVIHGTHTLLPNLTAFRFILIGHDDELPLYQAVITFLSGRPRLRWLDLGSCPSDLVLGLLPELEGLEALRIKFGHLTGLKQVESLVKSLSKKLIQSLHLDTTISSLSMNEYAPYFTNLRNLTFLHLNCTTKKRPKENLMSEKEHSTQLELWNSAARSVAICLPNLDFVGWHGEHYVVVRSSSALTPSTGPSTSQSSPTLSSTSSLDDLDLVKVSVSNDSVELKELPSRKRLDCAKGVDLGTASAEWLERKDVPMDYEAPGLE